jgi:hypothetical protein
MLEHLSPIGDNSKPKVKGYYFDAYNWVDKYECEIFDIKIDPKQYFVTSGEAVIKSSVLEEDLWSTYKKLYIYSKDFNQIIHRHLNSCWKSACQATNLTINLIEARGTHMFLETDWYEGLVLCYPKNPRGIKL